MLTFTDYQNVRNFEKLTYNHQKVFRHRIKTKCKDCLKDLKYVLLNYKKLKIYNPNKIIDLDDLMEILQFYEDLRRINRKV